MRIVLALVAILLVYTLTTTYAFAGVGGPVAPEDALPSERDVNIHSLHKKLDAAAVSDRLSGMGFSKEEIGPHLAMLTDEELNLLASDVESIETGGFGIWEVLVILMIIYLIIKYSEMMTMHRV